MRSAFTVALFWVAQTTAPILALSAVALVWLTAAGLAPHGRLALTVFAIAVVGWTVTRISDTTIALAAAVALVISGTVTPQQLFATLGNDLTWLLVAAFIIAAVLRETGLTTSLALRVASATSSLRQLFYSLTFIIVATASFIPSTSGRAALLVPVFLALVEDVRDRDVKRALALLFPTIILLSACGSLVGAAAHLIAVDFIIRAGGPRIGYFDWLVLGMPVALISSVIATEAILRGFLNRDQRRQVLPAPRFDTRSTDTQRRYVAVVLGITVLLWATGPWHGIETAVIALGSALVLTLPSFSGVALKAAIAAVEWEIVIFLAATLVIGQALLGSGAVQWLAGGLLASVQGSQVQQPVVAVILLAMISALSHLLIFSRSARVVVLVPTLALPFAALGYNPAALIFLCAIATGFCQTLRASAKPVALFGGLEQNAYDAKDLLKLSAILMPAIVAVVVAFALYVWPHLGLPLRGAKAG